MRGLEQSPDDGAIIRAVINLGRSLGIAASAEGVETSHQLDYLRAQGCGEVQGFYCGRPMPPPEARRLLRRRGQAAAAEPSSGLDPILPPGTPPHPA